MVTVHRRVATGDSAHGRTPFFEALVDNAQIALTRSDIDVAREYAQLAEPDVRVIFELIEAEHRRTVAAVRRVNGEQHILAAWPTIAATVERRNPHVDVLSHAQITLLEQLRRPPARGFEDGPSGLTISACPAASAGAGRSITTSWAIPPRRRCCW